MLDLKIGGEGTGENNLSQLSCKEIEGIKEQGIW